MPSLVARLVPSAQPTCRFTTILCLPLCDVCHLPPFEAGFDFFPLSLPFCSMFTWGGKSILSDWRLSSTVSLVACKACTQCDPGKDEMSTSLTCCIIRKKELFMNDEVTLCKCMYRACLCARRHRHLKEPLVFLVARHASDFRLSILSSHFGFSFLVLFFFPHFPLSSLPFYFFQNALMKALGANCR